jgi:hypothetical protein
MGRLELLALGIATILASACSVPPERSILEQFFAAARLRDNTVLKTLASVTFEPLDQGIIVDFEIATVTVENEHRTTVTITAPVKMPDGRAVKNTLVVTLERAESNGAAGEARRWMVTKITAIAAPRQKS